MLWKFLFQVPRQPFLSGPCDLIQLGLKHKLKFLENRERKGEKGKEEGRKEGRKAGRKEGKLNAWTGSLE